MIHLHSLRLSGDGYKLLRDGAGLRIEEWERPITVLIGENGSGKSTMLECLTWIFRALHERYVMGRTHARPPFEFELTYFIQKETSNGGSAFFDVMQGGPTAETSFTTIEVRVSGRDTGKKYELLMENIIGKQQKNGEWKMSYQKTTATDYPTLAPNLVVYYSGLSESIEGIYTAFEREYRNGLQRDARTSQDAYARLRVFPLYYLERGHFELLLAALYSYEDYEDVDFFFRERLEVAKSSTRCIRIDIRQKSYGNSKDPAEFWGAKGEMGIFLGRIRACATEEIANSDQSLTFWFDLENWYSLRATYVEERLLFTLLLLLHSEELLARLEVFYDLPGEAHVSHLHMSEGQQQLITLRALNELMVDENTLFLLDEPDTYLHPKWQAEFMQEIAPFTERATFLITTHSPLLLANFKGGNLFILKAGQARLVAGQYYGRTYGDSIRDVMNAGTRPEEVKPLFLKLFDLLDRSQWDAADEQLVELREMVGPDDAELVDAETMLGFMRPHETSETAE